MLNVFLIVIAIAFSPDLNKDQLALVPEAVRETFVAEFENYESLKADHDAAKLKDQKYSYAQTQLEESRELESKAQKALSKSLPFTKANTGDGSERTKKFRNLERLSIALCYADAHKQIAAVPANKTYVEELLPHLKDTPFAPLGTFSEYCAEQSKPMDTVGFREFLSELNERLEKDLEVAQEEFSKFETAIPEDLTTFWECRPRANVIFGYFNGVQPSAALKEADMRLSQSETKLREIWPDWHKKLYTFEAPKLDEGSRKDAAD